MATFGELKEEIAGKLTDGDLQYPTTSQIGDTINSLIKKYDNKHFWFTQGKEEITLNNGDPVIPDIPEDFKNEVNPGGFVIVYNQLRYPLEKVKPDIYDSMNVEGTGLPYSYTFRNGEYLVYFYPDQDYTMFINYRKRYDDLVADEDENDFTIYTPRLLVYASLEEIYATYKRDPDMGSYYQGKATDEFNAVMSETYERTASGKLTPDNPYSTGQYYDYWR
jgi:hypothetical protein